MPSIQRTEVVKIRRYRQGEEIILRKLFFNTVRTINSGDYSAEQVEAWAPEEIDEEQWQQRIAAMNPFVCLIEREIVGYAGVLPNGYVDQFFVHHLWQGKGVGTALMQELESSAKKQGIPELTSDVSITAMPFFKSQGYEIVTSQRVCLRDVEFLNYKMAKRLAT